MADTSASVTAQDLKYESAVADKIESSRGRHWTRVIPFARVTRSASTDEHTKNGWQLRHTASTPGHGTNLEAAIRDGVAAMPAGTVPRIVLASDGNENLGSVARGIWQAQQLGIPIDTIPLAGHVKPGLVLESVGFPRTGLQRRTLPHRGDARIAQSRYRERGDDRRRESDRLEQCATFARRQPPAP
ncbi:MAG: hypothetical protein WDO73_37655 [Ignavibacteriota bacterium]